jgi:hypothetical protein
MVRDMKITSANCCQVLPKCCRATKPKCCPVCCFKATPATVRSSVCKCRSAYPSDRSFEGIGRSRLPLIVPAQKSLTLPLATHRQRCAGRTCNAIQPHANAIGRVLGHPGVTGVRS